MGRETGRGVLRCSGNQFVGLRGVAQLGSAPALGAGGRRFKSCRPDHRTSCTLYFDRFRLVKQPMYNPCGCSSMVEFLPSKQAMPVRSRSPAPHKAPALQGFFSFFGRIRYWKFARRALIVPLSPAQKITTRIGYAFATSPPVRLRNMGCERSNGTSSGCAPSRQQNPNRPPTLTNR
jgi:hypothetical protein